MLRTNAPGDETIQGGSHSFVDATAEDLFRSGIEDHNSMLGIHRNNSIFCGYNNTCKALLGPRARHLPPHSVQTRAPKI